MKADKVAILVKIAALEFQKMANPMLAEYGITQAQYKILRYLYLHANGPVRQVDIEKYYSLTTPTTLGLLDTLEKKGLVVRRINPVDKRSRIIALTEKAMECQKQLALMSDELERQFTIALDDEERSRLVELMQKLLSGLRKGDNV